MLNIFPTAVMNGSDRNCHDTFCDSFFLCNRDALLRMDEGYKQMGRSNTHKEEDA